MIFLEEVLQDIGSKTKRIPMEDGRFNLLSGIGSGRPIFCLNAHSDTMPPSGERGALFREREEAAEDGFVGRRRGTGP